MAGFSRTRARDADRAQALEVLGAAYADGQLTHEEHSSRSARLQTARTFAELDEQLLDLQKPGEKLWRAPATGNRLVAPTKSPAVTWAVAAVGVMLVLGLILPRVFAPDDAPLIDDEVPAADGTSEFVNPMTPEGWDNFLAALDEQTGDTVVFEAYLSSDAVYLEAPVEAKGFRTVSWTWNGEWSGGGADTTMDWYARKDLSRIDATTFADAMESVSALIQEPEDQDISITGSLGGQDNPRACYAAYATNRFSETEVRYFSCKGKMLPE